ncbi:PREDICTED: protein tesmin/TSO1-like CXC 3 isoform X1 [Camelina sativa]|uniref:Protein tesmin/TSO1-like CXC 3 isoform X1 n=2 Tax=Camelina sativa TaxID=90675 RepID=A0ABM0Z7W5_CAMSA|nr:PREDICTED: protein tesmin/TSO1-like CXC 3 isoform X1 [Camelina sativa]
MDTPQKSITQIGTPVSKLKSEDSPVFNYICNLSPIKTLKSIPIAQTLSSLNFTSPPSVFSSPHAVSHKESRFRSQINKDVAASVGEEVEEEALIGNEPSQNVKNDFSTPKVSNDVRGGGNGSCEDGGMDLLKICDNVKKKSDTPDWETLIAATTELIYGSPSESEAFSCLLKRRSNSGARVRGGGGTMSTSAPVSSTVVGNNETESFDANSILHRGVRRRCLDFEVPGNNQQTLGESSSSCVVPSIGLHLNAIAMSSKENNNVPNEYSLSGNVKVGLQSSTSPVLHSQQDAVQAVEEFPKSLALVKMKPASPKKKRRKSEQSGEGESSCKRCNCKKSKCLKLYCECFAAGVYCIEPCSCIDCFNKPIHEDVVLATRKQIESRNPLAFAPKVIRNSDSIIEVGDDTSKTPASARHKRGCNCKKSNCLKKYCECYQGGVGCSINCRCEGCKNAFGRKDGSLFEQDEENEVSGKRVTAKTQQNAELFNPVAPPSTPIPYRQPLSQLAISSNNRLLPPVSHFHHGASGSSSSGIYNIRKPDMSMVSHSRIETITEDIDDDDDMPENLLNHSPMTNMKAVVSPNSKRVSLPHLDSSEETPWRRNGGRKLIHSIPSFPSLTPHH